MHSRRTLFSTANRTSTDSPPSLPRSWLANQGRAEEARAVLVRYNGEQEAAFIYHEIEAAIALEADVKAHTWSDVFKVEGGFRYRTLLGMASLFFQQMTGVNVISCVLLSFFISSQGDVLTFSYFFLSLPSFHPTSPYTPPRSPSPPLSTHRYYSTVIFTESVGLSRTMSLILSGCNGCNSLLFTIVGLFLVDRVGRVRLMYGTAAVQCIFFAVMAGVLSGGTPSYGEGVVVRFLSPPPSYHLRTDAPDAFDRERRCSSSSSRHSPSDGSERRGTLALSCFCLPSPVLLQCSLALLLIVLTINILYRLYPAEIMPLATRAAGASLASVSNWIFNFGSWLSLLVLSPCYLPLTFPSSAVIVMVTPPAIAGIGAKFYSTPPVLSRFSPFPSLISPSPLVLLR